jgi:hypothetical protein
MAADLPLLRELAVRPTSTGIYLKMVCAACGNLCLCPRKTAGRTAANRNRLRIRPALHRAFDDSEIAARYSALRNYIF